MAKTQRGRELVYSRQKRDFVQGRAYANPRLFTRPREDVTRVIVVGDYPNIVAAYEARGVEVERVGAPEAIPGASAPIIKAPPPAPINLGSVAIPDDWRDLPWSKPATGGGLTLRGLGSSVSPTPVLNKGQAAEAIEAELSRRAAGAVDPLDVPQPDANGLTIRELNADLESAGVEIDPADSPAQKLAKLEAAKAA